MINIRIIIIALKKSIFIVLSTIIRIFSNIKKNRVVCWSYDFTSYSCNPRYIAEYLSNYHSDEYEVYWIQRKDTDISKIDKHIKLVYLYSLKYFIIINTAKYLFNNERINFLHDFWIKRKGQKYIMTWHATMGLKKVERDAEANLNKKYIKRAKRDSKYCDLILSGCKYYTKRYQESFWYNGPILEKGTPRNDLFFKSNPEFKTKIFSQYNIPNHVKILLYAPTFRSDYKLNYYHINWNNIIPILNHKFNKEFYILLRLHPNFLTINQTSVKELISNDKVIDVTNYPDMQELLYIADVLVTDYSSSMFDFGMLEKPCFIYATDKDKYDRGFEMSLDKLPFHTSTNEEEFMYSIKSFDTERYKEKLKNFNENIIGFVEKGNACHEVYKWMRDN